MRALERLRCSDATRAENGNAGRRVAPGWRFGGGVHRRVARLIFVELALKKYRTEALAALDAAVAVVPKREREAAEKGLQRHPMRAHAAAASKGRCLFAIVTDTNHAGRSVAAQLKAALK